MYGLGRVGHLGNSGGLGWVLPGASIDMNFKDGLYYGAAPSQLAVSRASTAYADDRAGNWYQFASNVARITNKGLLSEESRTNTIRNNSGQGAVAGTPGTLPSNWQVVSQTIASSIVGAGSENGIDYVDIRLNGNTAAIDHINVYFEVPGQIATSPGQTWACSSFIKLVSGSMSGVAPSGLQLIIEERGTGGVFLGWGGGGSLTLTNAPLATQRYTTIYTTVNASIQSALPGIIVFFVANQALDMTLRFGWPSLELGNFVTSPIRTTGTTVFRATDVITLSNPPGFGAATTLFAQAIGSPKNPAIALVASDGTINNRCQVHEFQNNLHSAIESNGTSISDLGGPAWPPGVRGKIAMAISNGDHALVFNGAAPVTASPLYAAGSTFNQIAIGNSPDHFPWDGYIERIAIWPNTRLPNGLLQAVTT
jgi:hypothetical protein